jgi:hypothetical protein
VVLDARGEEDAGCSTKPGEVSSQTMAADGCHRLAAIGWSVRMLGAENRLALCVRISASFLWIPSVMACKCEGLRVETLGAILMCASLPWLVGIHDTVARRMKSVRLEVAPRGEGKGTIGDVGGLQDGWWFLG